MFRRRSRRRSYYPRRYSRRRRYYPSPLRTQMNDSETRTMSFVRSIDLALTVAAGNKGVVSQMLFMNLLSGSTATNLVTSGRIFHAGMMYDRFRVKSVSVRVRPKMMPAAAGVTNYALYLAWDRYSAGDLDTSELAADATIVSDDPSAKMIVWSPGGNASTISHYVYSLPKDRYQYIGICRNSTATPPNWHAGVANSEFSPTLRYLLDLGTIRENPITVNFVFQYRFTLEFMGSANFGAGSSGTSRFQSTSTPVDTSASGQPRLVPPN